jgi:hypothetical protein
MTIQDDDSRRRFKTTIQDDDSRRRFKTTIQDDDSRRRFKTTSGDFWRVQDEQSMIESNRVFVASLFALVIALDLCLSSYGAAASSAS